MLPIYVPASDTVITDYFQRYNHPVTGEVYGGTDYDNPVKLAEIGAVPLRVEQPAEGFDAETWEVVDDVANPGGKLRGAADQVPTWRTLVRNIGSGGL